MSDFLKDMAESSAARAALAGPFTDADFDKPVIPLSLGKFDVIAEIKRRSPAEGQLSPNGDSDPQKGDSDPIVLSIDRPAIDLLRHVEAVKILGIGLQYVRRKLAQHFLPRVV